VFAVDWDAIFEMILPFIGTLLSGAVGGGVIAK